MVEYPEGKHAACGAQALAQQVLAQAGPVDAVVASSFGGMVAAHLALAGAVRGVAFLGSFTRPEQLGVRGHLLPLMGPIAVVGRPGRLAATLASWQPVLSPTEVAEVVPTTAGERYTTWLRAFSIGREPPPDALRGLALSCVCIQGDRDVLVPPATLARLADALPPGTPRHVLRGAGHVPYFTHADACCRLLAPWLSALARRRARPAALQDAA
jgi:pimeloyl-ACP methyl ester carboxylesterase